MLPRGLCFHFTATGMWLSPKKSVGSRVYTPTFWIQPPRFVETAHPGWWSPAGGGYVYRASSERMLPNACCVEMAAR